MKNHCKSLIALCFIVVFQNYTFSQSLSSLSIDRGFREIKLGSSINNYNCFVLNDNLKPSLSFLFLGDVGEEISAYEFVANADYPYKEIGDIEILQMSVLVRNEKIIRIKLILEKRNDILQLLTYRYGEHTKYEDMVMPKYLWEANSGITCTLIGLGKMPVTTYSYILEYNDQKYWDSLKEEVTKRQEFNKQVKERKLKEQAKTQF